MIKEHFILGPMDLEAFDRTVKVMLSGKGVHKFTEKNDRWRSHWITKSYLVSVPEIVNAAIEKNCT
jgi:hypothetical protein